MALLKSGFYLEKLQLVEHFKTVISENTKLDDLSEQHLKGY